MSKPLTKRALAPHRWCWVFILNVALSTGTLGGVARGGEGPDEGAPPAEAPTLDEPAAETPSTVDKEALFKQVFGDTPAETVHRLFAPILVDGHNRGQGMVLLPRNGENLRVVAQPVLEALRADLQDDTLAALQALVDADGNLSLDALNAAGLPARFDEKRLELLLETPADTRQTRVTTLRQRGAPPGLEDALGPAPFSAYLNVRVGEDYTYFAAEGADEGRQPFNADLEAATNVLSWVLEGSARYSEDDDAPWMLGDLRVIKDDPAHMLRYSAGDVSAATKGYLGGSSLGGVAVSRNFALQPYHVTEPISQYEFFLKTDSTVELWINERLVQTLQLPAGRHDLRDLPLVMGVNDVRLHIIDNVGFEETLTFDAISASELLAAGLNQFSYSVGLPSTQDGLLRTYDTDRPTLSLFHRLGLSDTLTLGAFAQASLDVEALSPDDALAGLEGVWANPLGLWGLECAMTDLVLGSSAARLRYRDLAAGDTTQRWGGSLEWQGAQFGVMDGAAGNPYWLAGSVDYGQELLWGVYGNLAANAQLARTEDPSRYGLRLSLHRSFGFGLQGVVNLSQQFIAPNSNGRQEFGAYIGLNWAIPGQQQQVSASHDTSSETSRGSWRYNSPLGVGGFDSSAEVEDNPTSTRLSESTEYTSYRAKVRLSHGATLPSELEDGSLQSSLRLGTALVFVGGHFGLTRPVSDSFALVVPGETLDQLEGQTVRINPSEDYDGARVDWLGAGVLPSLSSYHLSTLHVEAAELPFGYELGQSKFDLAPTYKSGFLIGIGTDATVFLRGKLVNGAGEAVVLQAGHIVSLDDPQWEFLVMFTNRRGNFAVEGLQPGHFELRMFANPKVGLPFAIPEGTVGVYDVGSLSDGTASPPPVVAAPPPEEPTTTSTGNHTHEAEERSSGGTYSRPENVDDTRTTWGRPVFSIDELRVLWGVDTAEATPKPKAPPQPPKRIKVSKWQAWGIYDRAEECR